MRKVVLASNNAGKLREFDALLAPKGWTLVPQGELGVPEAPEPHPTFVENALAKARHACEHTGLPALADDSGLCVSALDGAPGVYSARFAAMNGGEKSDQANNAYLQQRLKDTEDRRAHYVAVLVFMRSANDPQPVIAQARWHGEIISEPMGSHGFGYDPYFYLPQFEKTVAQLDPAEKNRHSHRAQALQLLVGQLGDNTI
ncbi:MAG TPA: non-canonical purine NTP pyrophosphatase, RdgB/HAM1 family [Pusillimonas sp.]|nr:non-canonical purine NTP pyrophosphatase, RdgB/HAM1 family [Pusillimonas sp.]MBC43535.1 non-canonical purine NTP pyrophosphatase, RdgB/HAM1 family [Pusillimonas sp.]HBT33603.1 non-canonical purine NTP pyrophosphatase, RdgB/HAM1 family [Pusillimonas sp.]